VSAATQMPTWAVYCVAFGAPVLAFVGAFVGHWLGRKTAAELETRSKREETMRTLRWAAELAIDGDERRATLGFRQLVALQDSEMLDSEQDLFVDAALDSAVDDPVSEVAEIEAAGDVAEVEVVDSEDSDGQRGPVVPSAQEGDVESEGNRGD
jgi:hypothetical protein